MVEIEPIKYAFPVVKPKKIEREDKHKERQQPKKQQAERTNTEPLIHIDEIV